VGRKKTHEEYEQELFEKEIDFIPLQQYVNDATPILHECIEGHQRLVSPNNILHHGGCIDCDKIKRRKSTEKYLQDLAEKGINFELLEPYINSREHVLHRCSMGHEWKARPSRVLEGTGCPTCANLSRPGGYNKTRFDRDRELADSPGILYAIVLVNKKTDERTCLKIGITKGTSNKDVLKRAAGFTGYEPRIQKLVHGTLEQVFNLEQELHNKWGQYQYTSEWKFGGYSELFQIDKLGEILRSIPAKV